MLNILDRYEQIRFERINESVKYSGTCNIQEGEITTIDVTIKTVENEYLIGTMNARNNSGGVSINIVNSEDLVNMSDYAKELYTIRQELTDILL